MSRTYKKKLMGVVLKWQRNRTERPRSPPQIHQKITSMWSNFQKNNFLTQIPRKANQSLWNDVGQRIKMKRRQKILGQRNILGRES